MPYDGMMHRGSARAEAKVGRPRRDRSKNKTQRKARKRAR